MTPPLESRDELVEAVNAFVAEVKKLNEKMAEFPRRDEVTREGRTRAWRFLGFAVAIVLASQLVTVSMVSYCFLDTDNSPKASCNIMPGYHDAVSEGDARLARFDALLVSIENNQRNILASQEDIKALQKEIKIMRERG